MECGAWAPRASWDETSKRRAHALLNGLIRELNLDLHGLTVYTEAASGAYLLTPCLAACAGAAMVYAQTRDSRYGSAEDVRRLTMEAARALGIADRIQVIEQRCQERLSQSDIVTNSGFVRPIDAELVAALKPTAVIPLMWETWEYRAEDFDLAACRQRGILVLGTQENAPPCDMVPYCGFIALKLLFELGFDGSKVLVLGNPPYPGGAIVRQIRGAGIEVAWFSATEESDYHYRHLADFFEAQGHCYPFMLVAEHKHAGLLLGPGGYLSLETVQTHNPDAAIGIITGNVDAPALKASGLRSLPDHIAPFGFMSYQPYVLGPRPVLQLYGAGLKVGEVMARARLAGMGIRQAAVTALQFSPAMDFEGDLAWL
ncbi:hypothetical protein ACO9S2_03085 [Nitrospira sp. NS4]|uniref:hypothetical protein n=1 Tax=Nitrospira sp. NS4 TaxID=3414498 RepID=UPI003C2C839D